MCSIKTLTFTFLTLLLVTNAIAQESTTETKSNENLSLTEGTIENQFEYVIQRSNNYQDFKVVKKTWLAQLKQHAIDSLKVIQKDLIEAQSTLEAQSIEITELKEKLSTTKASLTASKEEKDNMSLFGIPMSKTNYSLILWGVVGVLFAVLLLFIYKFRNSNALTKQSKKALEDTEEEFEEHRRNALEREQIVRRQLLDEINKHKKGK